MHIQGVQLAAEPILESKNSLIGCTITIYIIPDFFLSNCGSLPESGQHCCRLVTNDTTPSAVLSPAQSTFKNPCVCCSTNHMYFLVYI